MPSSQPQSRLPPHIGLALFVLATLSIGCSSDGSSDEQRAAKSAATSSESTALERAEAVRKLGDADSITVMPTVIEAMNDPAPAVRQAAAEASRKIVGTGIRYRPYDKPEARQQAADSGDAS